MANKYGVARGSREHFEEFVKYVHTGTYKLEGEEHRFIDLAQAQRGEFRVNFVGKKTAIQRDV